MTTRALFPLLSLAIGCATLGERRSLDPATVDPPPAWSTEDGRQVARVELVDSLLDNGQPEAALTVLREMRAAGAEGRELDVLEAQALRSIGLFEDAELKLRSALRAGSRAEDAAAHNQLGVLYADQQELDAAITSFRRAHRIDKENPEYANNLGFTLMAMGETGEAVDVLRAALQADATRIRTRNNLGFALMADGRAEEAYRVFRSASTEAEARYNQGVGYELTGHPSQAATAYQAALAADPEHTRAQQALSRLRGENPEEDSP